MIKIKNFMIKDVITIDCSENVYEAAKKMEKNSVSCLVVLENKKPIGLLTERTIVREVMLNNKDSKKTKVKDAIHKLEVISPEDDFFSLINLMKNKNVRRVVVVNKNKELIGIVTETDIINASRRLQKEIEKDKTMKGKEAKDMINKLNKISFGFRKMDTGYEDLNKILYGGFPLKKSILLEGPPGSGKGLIAFNFMKTGLKSKNKVIYICMNEIIEDIEGLFSSLEIDIEKYIKSKDFKIINMYEEVVEDSKRIYNLEEKLLVRNFEFIKKNIDEIIKNSDIPSRCVVNVISQALAMYEPKIVYKFVLMLNSFLKQKNITTLYFIHKGGTEDQNVISMEEIMDGVIEFNIIGEDSRLKKIMEIKKMKPEFSVLPQVFYYRFDKKKKFYAKQKK